MHIYLLIHIYILCLSIYMYIHINIRIYTGSFGISACCSLDRDLVVLACRGQAMSLAFNEVHGVVLWGSEVCGQVSGHVCIHTIMCIPSCVFERELVLIKCSVHPISRMMIACITSNVYQLMMILYIKSFFLRPGSGVCSNPSGFEVLVLHDNLSYAASKNVDRKTLSRSLFQKRKLQGNSWGLRFWFEAEISFFLTLTNSVYLKSRILKSSNTLTLNSSWQPYLYMYPNAHVFTHTDTCIKCVRCRFRHRVCHSSKVASRKLWQGATTKRQQICRTARICNTFARTDMTWMKMEAKLWNCACKTIWRLPKVIVFLAR